MTPNDPNWSNLDHSTARSKPMGNPFLAFTVVPAIMLLVTVVWLCFGRQADAQEAAVLRDNQQYYSKTCSQLHHLAQQVHEAEKAFDEADTESVKSEAWDEYQLVSEQRNQVLEQHLNNVAWHASMGNPPRDQACLK